MTRGGKERTAEYEQQQQTAEVGGQQSGEAPEERVFNRAERRKMAKSFARRNPGQRKPNAAEMREARKNIAEALKPKKD